MEIFRKDRLSAVRTCSKLIYFDSNAQFYALDSALAAGFGVSVQNGDVIWDSIPQGDCRAVTDGLNFYAFPHSLTEPEEPDYPALDQKALQDYFFSPRAAAAALGVEASKVDPTDRASLTYGTTGAASLYAALRRVRAGSADTFLDIGSGCGLPVILASHLVKRAVGVEIVGSMVKFAREAAREWQRINTEFLVANIREVDVSEYDIVYVAATTLTDELRHTIGEKLRQLRPGAVVLSLTYAFAHDHLVLTDTFKSAFSWWHSSSVTEHHFYVHLRRAP